MIIMHQDIAVDEEAIMETSSNLTKNGMETTVVETSSDALALLLGTIPEGADVYDMTSVTLEEIGFTDELKEGTKFISVRKEINSINDPAERLTMRRKRSVVSYAVGSANAVTRDGKLVFGSYSGSQLAPYAFTADNVVLVIGAQKIVGDLKSAFIRIEEYVVELEENRVKPLGTHTEVNKTMVIGKEVVKGRLRVILVRERLGF